MIVKLSPTGLYDYVDKLVRTRNRKYLITSAAGLDKRGNEANGLRNLVEWALYYDDTNNPRDAINLYISTKGLWKGGVSTLYSGNKIRHQMLWSKGGKPVSYRFNLTPTEVANTAAAAYERQKARKGF